MLDFLGIIGWEKWVGWRLPPQTPLFRGKSQSPTFAIEWKNRNHYFYRAAAHRCNHYRQLLMRKWRKGPLASSNQPTWSEPESKRGVCHIFKLLSVQRKVSGFGRHTVKYKVVCCYWVVLCIYWRQRFWSDMKKLRGHVNHRLGEAAATRGDYGTSRNTKCQLQINRKPNFVQKYLIINSNPNI